MDEALGSTDIRICVYYRRKTDTTCDYQIEIASRGAEPRDFGPRAACGVLLIGLSTFEIVHGIPSEILPQDYSDCVVVDTETQKIYGTDESAEATKQIATTAFSILASRLGIDVETQPLTRGDAVEFISAAIRGLGGTDLESMVNARGGQA